MNLSIILILAGLSLSTLASLVMLYPYLRIKRNVHDNFIVDMDKKTGDYTRKRHIKDRKLGIADFVLFVIGLGFQIVGIFLVLE